jgi:signal transduction histidine kinase/ActR/RegA family two-component response regulator
MKNILSHIAPPIRSNATDITEDGRNYVAFVTSVIAIIYAVTLGTYVGIVDRMIFQASINFTMAAMFAIIAMAMRNPARSEMGRISLLVLTSVFFLYNLWSGAVFGTGYLWSFVLPTGYYFLTGRRYGTIGNIVYFFVAILTMRFPQSETMARLYSVDFTIRFCAVYLMLWLISFFYEFSREFSERALKAEVCERIQSEKALSVAKITAEEANEAKSLFLANMSHEIRTPMNGVLGLGSLLSETEIDNVQREYVDNIMKSANSLMTLINDILDYSKIEANKITLEEIPFDLGSTVEAVVDVLRYEAKEKGLGLDLQIGSDVPGSLIGDPGRIRQILMNLVGNAVKFTAAGKVSVSVSVIGHIDNRVMLRFTIRDSGIGIPDDARPKLFQLFSQVDPGTTRRFGGTGLGLAISKRLTELMGGEIGFESEVGLGSSFWFTAAFGRSVGGPQMEHRDEEPLSASKRSSPEDRASGLRILFAEDNRVNQMVFVRIIEKAGFSCVLAGNGVEAVEALKRKEYDLIFMDVQMPLLSGYDATRAIRALEADAGNGRHIPIIAMTASAMKGDREKCLECGMDDYLSKPVNREEFLDKIRYWARKK